MSHDEINGRLLNWGIEKNVELLMKAARLKDWGHAIIETDDRRLVLALTRPISRGSDLYGLTLAWACHHSTQELAAATKALKVEAKRWAKEHGLIPAAK